MNLEVERESALQLFPLPQRLPQHAALEPVERSWIDTVADPASARHEVLAPQAQLQDVVARLDQRFRLVR